MRPYLCSETDVKEILGFCVSDGELCFAEHGANYLLAAGLPQRTAGEDRLCFRSYSCLVVKAILNAANSRAIFALRAISVRAAAFEHLVMANLKPAGLTELCF
jgi:hypothetical protein